MHAWPEKGCVLVTACSSTETETEAYNEQNMSTTRRATPQAYSAMHAKLPGMGKQLFVSVFCWDFPPHSWHQGLAADPSVRAHEGSSPFPWAEKSGRKVKSC